MLKKLVANSEMNDEDSTAQKVEKIKVLNEVIANMKMRTSIGHNVIKALDKRLSSNEKEDKGKPFSFGYHTVMGWLSGLTEKDWTFGLGDFMGSKSADGEAVDHTKDPDQLNGQSGI